MEEVEEVEKEEKEKMGVEVEKLHQFYTGMDEKSHRRHIRPKPGDQY